MRKSKSGGGLMAPPPLAVTPEAPVQASAPEKRTMNDFVSFRRQSVLHQNHQLNAPHHKLNVFAPTPKEGKDDNPLTDDVMRKLDLLTREVHRSQMLICNKLDKLDQSLHTKQFESKLDELKPVVPGTPSVPESDEHTEQHAGTPSLKRRFSLFKRRESLFSSRFTAPKSPPPNQGLVGMSAGITAMSAGSWQDAPCEPESPRIVPESPLREETESSQDEDMAEMASEPKKEEVTSDTDPGQEFKDAKERSPKHKQSVLLHKQSVNTLHTDTWRTWRSDNNARRSTLLEEISGSISASWARLVSSYAVHEGDLDDESIAAMVSSKTTKQGRTAFMVWNFLDNPDSSWRAKLYGTMEPYVLTFAVFFSLLQTLPDPPSFWLSGLACMAIDFCIDSLIMFDVLVRFAVSPSHGRAFFKEWLNFIDMLAAWPLVLRIFLVAIPGSSDEPLFFCLVAIARLLKMMRRFQKIHLLIGAFELVLEALPVLTYILSILALTFSTAVYLVEPRDEFDTLPRSIYFILVTITSLGYGDYTPTTTQGQFIVSILTILSSVYVAIPLGLVGSAFTTVWQDRDRILLMKKTRQAMLTWGFTAEDIPTLFTFFDSKGCGSLSLHDFRDMIVAMRIGLNDKRVRELFHTFDKNNSGRINDQEFVREMFPEEYFEAFTIVSETASSLSPPSSNAARQAPATGVGTEGLIRRQVSIPDSNEPSSPASSDPGRRGAQAGGLASSGSPTSSVAQGNRSSSFTPARSLSVPLRSPSGRSYLMSPTLPNVNEG